MLVLFPLALAALLPQVGPPQFSGPRAGVNLPQTQGLEVTEKLRAAVPKDLVLHDPAGAAVRFGDLFDGKRPVVLSFNYEACPQLCSIQLGGFVETLNKESEWSVGEQFRIVTVSLDPSETEEQAQRFRARVLEKYKGGATDAARAGWTFLRGTAADVRALADAVGYGYKYVEERKEYAHTATIVLLTPDGLVSRYLYGINFDPQVLRLSLAETAAREYLSTRDRIILSCFVFDPTSNSYTMRMWTLARIVLSVIALTFIGFLWWLHRHTRPNHELKAAA